MQAEGVVTELMLADGLPTARIACASGLVPAPGQYALAHDSSSWAPLAAAVFAARVLDDGFVCAPPVPLEWRPGSRLQMRGPLGAGFTLPATARRVALIAVEKQASRLLALLDPAVRQGAALSLVCDEPPAELPLQVEVQPLRAAAEVCGWSDYAAFDLERESLPMLTTMLGADSARRIAGSAQVLVRVPMPCGGLADCGVCTVRTRAGPRLACKDGPVFALKSLILEI